MKRPPDAISAQARPWSGLLLLGALALPWNRALLEGQMVLHQLVQMPLLALAGWWLGCALWPHLSRSLSWPDAGGVSGLLCILFASLFWMLPRYLDASLRDPVWEALKFLTVPLCIGVPAAVSWPRLNPILRGVAKAELFVMLLRLAWLYLDSPVRVCSNYLLREQRQMGYALIALACVWAGYEALRFFFGNHYAAPHAGHADRRR